jgi:ABC-type nitrate/sulfonate/bicarbonate transport system ATPase subunit
MNIQTDKVSVSYNGFSIIEKIDFTCRYGERISIIGKSGAGKTTFLNALAGFIPFTGKIKIPKNIGYVFQNHSLFPWMTVEKNIGFGIEKMDLKKRNKLIREMLIKIELPDFAKKYPYQLSGGQIQRVAFARAMAQNPDVLLLDEPFASLDHYTRENMQNWLISFLEESTSSMILVTHSIDEAIFFSDRVAVLKDQKFVEDIHIQVGHPRQLDFRFSNKFMETKKILLKTIS